MKSKQYLILFLLQLSSILVFCQQEHPIRNKLKAKYDYVGYFENNVAEVRTFKDTYTLIDTLGYELFPPKFAYIHNTRYNLLEAGVWVNNVMKRGYINKKGEVVIPLQYDNVFMPNSNFAIVEKNKTQGVIDNKNKVIIPIQYQYITEANDNNFIVQQNNLFAFFNNKGKPLTSFLFKEVERFYNKVATVFYPNNSSCLIDTNGKALFNSIPNSKIYNSVPNYAKIFNTKTRKFGIVNFKGNYTVPTNYDEISLYDSISIVKQNKKTGIITNEGKITTPLLYDAIYKIYPSEDKFYVYKNNLKGIIDLNNNNIIQPKYFYINCYLEKYFIVKNLDSLYGIFDSNGNSIIPEKYRFYTTSINKIFASKNNQFLIIDFFDTTKNIVLPTKIKFKPNPESYNNLKINKFQVFIQNNLFGLINDSGVTTIPAQYEDIQLINSASYFQVKLKNKFGIVNSKGKLLKPIIYDAIHWRKEYLALKINGKKVETFSTFVKDEEGE